MHLFKGIVVIVLCVTTNIALANSPAGNGTEPENPSDTTKVTYSLFNFFYEFAPKKDSAATDKKNNYIRVKKPGTSGK